MPHVIGQQRNQVIMLCLESSVSGNAFVRVIDAFVEATDLESFGFAHTTCKDEGRPSYHPSVLLKLYLYGYHNGIRIEHMGSETMTQGMDFMPFADKPAFW